MSNSCLGGDVTTVNSKTGGLGGKNQDREKIIQFSLGVDVSPALRPLFPLSLLHPQCD
jgi:hypothetical protein